VATWCEVENVRGTVREYCHTFFGLDDGSAMAFFQFFDPADHEELVADTRDTLQHVALEVDDDSQDALIGRLDSHEVPYRIIDHGYCRSLYVIDPDGLTVEFTADPPDLADINEARRNDAHSELQRWLAGDRRPNNDLRRFRDEEHA
jgi:catechol-2,3-dioxygenase